MPGPKKKTKEKLNALTTYFGGKYAPCIGPYLGERVLMESGELLFIIDPDLANEYKDFNSGYREQYAFHVKYNKELFKQNGMAINYNTDADTDEEYKNLEYIRHIDKKIGDYIDNLEGDGLAFKPYFEAIKTRSELENGDLNRALNDSPGVYGLNLTVTYGPLLMTKTVSKTDEEIIEEASRKKIPVEKVEKEKNEIDFKKIKEGMGEAFIPYMELFKDYNATLALEYEKQKLEDGHADAETETEFKERYRLQLEKNVNDFKTIKQVEIDHPKVYGTDVLNNSLDDLVGVSPDEMRTIEAHVAFMEGQAKALKNGWSLEDSSVLGIIGYFSTNLEKTEAYYDNTIKNYGSTVKKDSERLEGIKNDLEAYKEKNFNEDQMSVLIKPHKKIIDEYQQYFRELSSLEKTNTPMDEILEFQNQNEDIVDNYNKINEQLSLKTGIEDVLHYYYLKDEEKSLTKKIKNKTKELEEYKEKALSISNVVTEIKALKKECFDKEILDLNDSRKIFRKLESFIEKNRDVMGATQSMGEEYFDTFKNMIEVSKNRLEKGRISELGEEGESLRLNKIYASEPSYDKFPFNETEIAALGFGSTLNNIDKELGSAFLDATLRNVKKSGTADGFSGIIEIGKQNAKSAMENYVAGDRQLLVSSIHNGCFAIQKDIKEAKRIDDKAAAYTAILDSYDDILKRDPSLLKDLKTHNSKMPANERVDFDELRRMQTFARTVVQGRNAKIELADKEKNTPLQNALLIKKAVKADIMNELVYNDSLSEKDKKEIFTKEGQKQFDRFVGNMIEKYGVNDSFKLKWNAKKSRTEFGKLYNEITNSKEKPVEIIEDNILKSKAEKKKKIKSEKTKEAKPAKIKEAAPKAFQDDPEAGNLIVNNQTADKYIEILRDKGFKTINTNHLTKEIKDDYGDKFLKIIAARQLAGAGRKDSQKLKSFAVTPEMINDRVAEMKKDEVFKGFISSIKKSNYKMITAITAARMSIDHGAKLDDMLKEYMLNLPPGEMKNSKLHERYLPKAVDRIETLQKQVEKLQKKNTANKEEDKKKEDQLVKAVAEIIELRNIVKAEAGNKNSLSKKITANQLDLLKSKVDTLAANEAFRFTARQRDVQNLVIKGHGGKMTAKVRELYSARFDKDIAVSDIIDSNTIEKRMAQLKQSAGRISASLHSSEDGSAEQNKLVQDGKNLMEEYSLLFAKVVNPDTFEVEEDKLKKDVPWQKVRELKTKNTTFTERFRHVTGFFSANDIAECLDSMSTQSLADFKTFVNTKIVAVSARIKKLQNPVGDQQLVEAEPNQVPAKQDNQKNKKIGRQKK